MREVIGLVVVLVILGVVGLTAPHGGGQVGLRTPHCRGGCGIVWWWGRWSDHWIVRGGGCWSDQRVVGGGGIWPAQWGGVGGWGVLGESWWCWCWRWGGSRWGGQWGGWGAAPLAWVEVGVTVRQACLWAGVVVRTRVPATGRRRKCHTTEKEDKRSWW